MQRICRRTISLLNEQRSALLFAKANTPSTFFLRNQRLSVALICSQTNPDGRTKFGGFMPVFLETKSDDPTHDTGADEFSADVEKLYRVLRKFQKRVPKLELALQKSGVIMRPGLPERVLNRLGDAGNLGFRFFVWASKQPGYKPSYEVHKAMIKALGKMRQFGAVWALIEEMRSENPYMLTAEVFGVLIRRFDSARIVKKAGKVLDEMPKKGCEADECLFGCLLEALCKKGSIKEAASLFEDMKVRFNPTLEHFASLLSGWCREGKILEAKHVLVQTREAGFAPDIVLYNTLLGACAKAGKMQDALDLLEEMRRVNCGPNAVSYTVLIQAFCELEKMDEAMQIFVEMQGSGCEADVMTYTTLISGFCKCGNTNRAYEILDDMIRKGNDPIQLTYSCILMAHEKKEELEECMELMEEMRKIGCFPDLNIYNIVIRLACQFGKLKEAVRLWGEMEADGVNAGVDTYILMVNGFLSRGCLIEACDYFKEMVERGLLSGRQYGTFDELAKALLRAEKLEVAKNMWSCVRSKGSERSVEAWTIWIHALFSSGNVREACDYCLYMIDADVMMQHDTFAKLMIGIKKLYNRQVAEVITNRVRQMAADRKITFKMYKRRGVSDIRKLVMAKVDGRKTRARGFRWSGVQKNPKPL